MLQCKFCPWTRLPELKGGKFQTWSNPVPCRDTGEVPRNAYTHVNGAVEGGNRGWHQFWYAVHSLYPEVACGVAAGVAAAGGGGPPGDRQQMIEWVARKVNNYRACWDDFEDAGLLVPDGAGAAFGIVDKFRMAAEVLGMMRQVHPGMMAPPKAKMRLHLAPSRSVEGAEMFSPDRIAPQHDLPLPPAETDGMRCVEAYSVLDQDPNFGEGLLEMELFGAHSPRAGATWWTSSDAADFGASAHMEDVQDLTLAEEGGRSQPGQFDDADEDEARGDAVEDH
jgi:hypothetical protein